MQFTCGIQHPQYDVLGYCSGIETSTEVPHHAHGHSWCYLQMYERSLAVQVVFFFHVDPEARTESTHLKIVFRLGTLVRRPSWE